VGIAEGNARVLFLKKAGKNAFLPAFFRHNPREAGELAALVSLHARS